MATCTSATTGLWSADDSWTITGIGTASGSDGVLSSGTLTPTVSPTWTVNALVGRRIKLNATWYSVSANSATAATITSPPADATYTYLLGGKPLDSDVVVIGVSAGGHTITFDQDHSTGGANELANGIAGITIKSHASAVNVLKFKNDADGTYWLKIKATSTIAGDATSTTLLGRLIMASEVAVSTHTDNAANDTINETSTGRVNGDQIVFVAGTGTLPVPLVGNTVYWVVEKAANTFKVSATRGGAAINLTVDGAGTYNYYSSPGVARKQVIEFAGTTAVGIVARYLSCILIANEPTNRYATIVGYGSSQNKVAVTVSDSGGDALFTVTGTAPADGTIVKLTASAMPGGFNTTYQYYVVSSTGASHTFKLALYTALTPILYSSAGTTVYYYLGIPTTHGAGSGDELVVLEDVATADPLWSTTSQYNRIVVADEGPADVDTQILTMAAITTTTIELSADTDSALYPGAKVWLASRNVQILSASTSTSQGIFDATNNTGSATNPNVIGCAVIPTASITATKYTYGVTSGTSHTVSGTISGCTNGVNAGTGIGCGAVLVSNTNQLRTTNGYFYATSITGGTVAFEMNQTKTPYMGNNPFGCWSYDTKTSGGTVNNGSLYWVCQGGTGSSFAYNVGTHGALPAGWTGSNPDWIHTSLNYTDTVPTGATVSPNWIDIPIQAVDGETIKIQVCIKPSTVTGGAATWTTAPQVQIINKGLGWNSGGTFAEVLDYAAHTLGGTTWELLEVEYTATAEKQLALRVTGTKSTTTGSFDWCWRLAAGGGGVIFTRRNTLIGR